MIKYDHARYAEALRFALEAHGEKLRKGSAVPYITHPVGVSAILARYECSEDAVIAGLLHDTVEDTDVTLEDLRKRFGERAAGLVAGVTEEKRRDGEDVPWRERKEQQIAHVMEADYETLLLKAADALHNTESILRDLRIQGENAWDKFNGTREEVIWYHRTLAERIGERLPGNALAAELLERTGELAKEQSKA